MFLVLFRGLFLINVFVRFVKFVGCLFEMKIIFGCIYKVLILWMWFNIEYFIFFLRVCLMCVIINKF